MVLRRRETATWSAFAFSVSPHSSSTKRSAETTSLAFSSSSPSSARCFAPPSGSGRSPSYTSSGPRILKSIARVLVPNVTRLLPRRRRLEGALVEARPSSVPTKEVGHVAVHPPRRFPHRPDPRTLDRGAVRAARSAGHHRRGAGAGHRRRLVGHEHGRRAAAARPAHGRRPRR